MNKFTISLIISSLAGLSTLIGGVGVFIKIKNKESFLSLILSFSLSVMICISIFDLIPTSFITLYNEYGLLLALIIGVGVFLIGNGIITKLNKIITPLQNNNLYKVGLLSMIALMIHNFPEGIATFITSYNDISMGINLGFAIMLHNIPEGISISLPIYYSTGNKLKGLLYTFISGLAEPMGAITAYILLKPFINNIMISIVLILVAGIMITLSIEELLPEVNSYNKKKESIIGLVLGFIIIIVNLLLF